MPFTPTHILAVVPVAAFGRCLPFSALVIGSMIPDLPFFVPQSPSYETMHSGPGLITACLPLGLVGFLLFQHMLKRPLAALLPEALGRRCGSITQASVGIDPRSLAWAALAVVVGASTHVVWDAFTHRGRWGTDLIPRLDETALTLAGQDVPGYKVMQYGSTLIGLPCLAMLLATWLHRQPPTAPVAGPVLSGRSKLAVAFVTVLASATVAVFAWFRDDGSAYERLGRSITSAGLALMVVILGYAVAFRVIEGRAARAA